MAGMIAIAFALLAFQDPVELAVDGRPVAAYHATHEKVLRPFLAHLRAPNGAALTRAFPPVEGRDATDHADTHPGLWMGFGDLAGADFWRNKGRVEDVRVDGAPGRDALTQVARYVAADRVVCVQTLRVSAKACAGGTLLVLDAAFRSDEGDFAFGDQEEMGVGLRVATPLTVKAGGRMTDSEGRVNEKGIWGKSAAWCDYSGTHDGWRLGVTLIPDPSNFRASWWHVRDYGVMVANPFGRAAMTKGEPSRVAVRKGEVFRLRFGAWLHARRGDEALDLPAAAAEAAKAMAACPRPEAAAR
jgi:hypothetical protein